MIFKDQLESRSNHNKETLADAFDDLNSIVNRKGKNINSQNTKSAFCQILNYLGVNDYKCNELADDIQENYDDVFKAHNILTRSVLLKNKWWRHASGPMLATDHAGNVVALIPSYNGYKWTNPETQKIETFSNSHTKLIKENAFCFYRTLPNRAITLKDLFKFMYNSLSMSDAIYVVIACFIVILFGMFTPYVNKLIFNDIIPTGNTRDILPIAGLLIGASIGSIMFGMTRSLVLLRVRDKIKANLQAAIIARTYSLPSSFFKKYTSGDLSNRVMSISNLCQLINDTTLSGILIIIFSMIYLYQIYIYANSLLVLCIILFIVNFLVIGLILRAIIKNNEQLIPLQSKLQGVILSLFSGVQKIKTSGSEVRAFSKWAKAYKEAAIIEFQPIFILKISLAITSLLTFSGVGLIYYYTIENNISLADYIAFNSAFGMISGAITSFVMIMPNIAHVKPLVKLIAPILEEKPESDDSATMIKSLSGAIEITNLTFRYSPETPYIFNGFNLKIKAGEFVALVGSSGCGKSTLLRLMLGFEQAESGTIFYDQYNIDKVNKQSLRRCIGTCLQNGQLFPGNIFENITVTAPWSKMSDAWEAAKISALDDELEEMPMKMHTVISEGGGGVSGGQKQRLLIARSIVNKPSILFFDEATSALDNIKQKIVSDNIEKMGCTRITVAHRLSTIKNCDRIIVIDKGVVVEDGNFNDLISQKGLFYELSKKQL